VGITSDLVMHPFIKDCPATFTGGYMFYFRDVRWSGAGDRKGMLWMVAKSCIILDGWNPMNNWIFLPPINWWFGFLGRLKQQLQLGDFKRRASPMPPPLSPPPWSAWSRCLDFATWEGKNFGFPLDVWGITV
jgi:hypothetical protein